MAEELTVWYGAEVTTAPADRAFVVGRGAGVDLRLADARVSRRHILVERSDTGWSVVDISANGTWVEGERVRRVDLRQATRLNLGAVDGPRIILVPGSPAPQAAARRPLPAQPAAPAAALGTAAAAAAPPPSAARPQAAPAAAGSSGAATELPAIREVARATARPAGQPVAPPGLATDAPAPVRPAETPARLTDRPAPVRPADASAPVRPTDAAESARATPVEQHVLVEHHELQTIRPSTPRTGTGPVLPDGTAAQLAGQTGAGRTHPLRAGRTLIGRARSNDIVVGDLLASREHAELFVGRSGIEIVDLGSANGTFVNGQRVVRAVLSAGDLVAIGHHVFDVEPAALVEYLDTGDVTFEVDGLSVDVGETRLLHDVTFRLPGRALLAVIGPSGAGKSTLLNALTGFRPANVGTVRYAGRDLYGEYDELRRRIGYVPQDDILHRTLTVREALEYGARLRFPAETTKQERRDRVDAVLAELGLAGAGGGDLEVLANAGFTAAELGATAGDAPHGSAARPDGVAATDLADRKISTLSGGQRKRTSVALELLTQPTLLYLDEPTSGLDPGLDKEVMESLRTLADDGRTVVVVTHSVAQLELCDYVLVLAKGGHVAYFGPPQHALAFFGQADWADTFRILKTDRGARVLAARYRASGYHVQGSARTPGTQAAPAPLPGLRQQSVLSQLVTLSHRYLRVIASDRSYLRLIIAYPVLLGLIPRGIQLPHGLGPAPGGQPNREATLVLLVVVLCAVFMGASNAVREIVKEREIYRRERGIGLSMTAYLGSKVGVLTLVTVAQSVVMTTVALTGSSPHGRFLTGSAMLDLMIVISLVAVTSAMMGLVISALVDNADKTMPLLVLLAMAQLIFTGGLMPVAGRIGLEQAAYLFPARWGYAATASVGNLISIQDLGNARLNPGSVADPLWKHTAATYLTDIAGLATIALLCVLLTALLLRRLDPRVIRHGGRGR